MNEDREDISKDTAKKYLDCIGEKVRAVLDEKDEAREQALPLSREVIRNSANAIRHIHRQEFEESVALMDRNAELLVELQEMLEKHPDIYWAGFVNDAQKEYAEARTTYALVHGQPLPDPDEVGVPYAAYLNGLGEAVGEMRRYILDQIRTRGTEWSEAMLSSMDDIYYLLVSMDYPPAITGGLRRTADVTRSIIEKTRGDLTTATRSKQLEDAMRKLEGKLQSE